MEASETLYQKAHEMHHEEGDIDGAVDLYREVLQQFPASDAASRAASQLESIDDMSEDKLFASQAQAERDRAPAKSNEPSFGALRIVSGFFKILAVFNLIAGFITALVASSEPDMGISAVVAIVGGAISAILCWALADLIRVLLSIELHVRRVLRALEPGDRTDSQSR